QGRPDCGIRRRIQVVTKHKPAQPLPVPEGGPLPAPEGGHMITVATAVSRFFTWWSGELAACVPDRLCGLLRGKSSLLIMTIGNEAMQATLRSGGRVRQLGRIPLAAASRRALADLIGHASPRSPATVVEPSADHV